MKRLVVTLLLVAVASSAHGYGAPYYNCDPTKCKGSCHCASNSPPGGLPPAQIPQFIVFTHDDAITALTNSAIRRIVDGRKNPNGCNVPVTFFTLEQNTDCNLAKQFWSENHEIALHTVHHPYLRPGFPNMNQEMMGVKDFLVSQCGIAASDIVGFRDPYLINNPQTRAVQFQNKILYDSSIDESVGQYSGTSPSFGQRVFPYSMDFGIAQNCNWTYPDGQCLSTERYPGMWEIPMWDVPSSTTSPETNAYTMDYGPGFGGDVFTTFQTNFDQAYNGNRAPFPVYIHTPWLNDSNIAATNKFFDYAQSKPDVYFVTMHQLIQWMENPVPASQVGSTLTCKPVNLTAPAPPLPCQTYTVQQGDYMDLIAGKFGVATQDLINANPGFNASNIQVGQKINIPPYPPQCDTPGGAAALIAAAQAQAQDPVPQAASTVALAPTTFAPDVTAGAAPIPAPNAQTPTAPVPAATVPSNRVEANFVVQSQNPATSPPLNQIINVLSQLLSIFPDHITMYTTPTVSRRRTLLQTATTNSSAVNVHAVIGADDPSATYTKMEQEIQSGDFESMMTSLGMMVVGTPTLMAYKDGVVMNLNAVAAPPNAPVHQSSVLPLGAIIGIAVGGGVILIAIVAIIATVMIRRRRARYAARVEKAANQDTRFGAAATLKVKTSTAKYHDDFAVVKGETPDSATLRNNARTEFMV